MLGSEQAASPHKAEWVLRVEVNGLGCEVGSDNSPSGGYRV
jgi:hypothetical protein